MNRVMMKNPGYDMDKDLTLDPEVRRQKSGRIRRFRAQKWKGELRHL